MKISIFIGRKLVQEEILKEIYIQTIEDIIKNNRHKKEKNMILKMDIESAEWNALNDISENILKE